MDPGVVSKWNDKIRLFVVPAKTVPCASSLHMVSRETAAVSAGSVYTIPPRTISRQFMQSHRHRVHTCLAVTCHLHFRQNDRDLYRATTVTRVTSERRRKKEKKEKDYRQAEMDPHKYLTTWSSFSFWVCHIFFFFSSEITAVFNRRTLTVKSVIETV